VSGVEGDDPNHSIIISLCSGLRERVVDSCGRSSIVGRTRMATEKPVVDRGAGAPPQDLVVEDLAVGDGTEAKSGQHVTVHYVGVSFDSGQQFDASWDRGEAFAFPLGGGRVIAGWDQGVAGMRVGGRRKLTIPAHLAYGDQGAGGVIKPGATLIFVVDLLAVG
jgi:peptidylprolyl isomerase